MHTHHEEVRRAEVALCIDRQHTKAVDEHRGKHGSACPAVKTNGALVRNPDQCRPNAEALHGEELEPEELP